jgi:CubicO group peptidase (beta-lactamase class C family)
MNLKKKEFLILILMSLATLTGQSLRAKIPQPPDSVKNVAELDMYLEKLVNSGTPQGLSLVIVKNDSIVYTKGFGWADRPRNIPATPRTVYHWWSITKIPTAIAILQLREQGKLQLDDPVSKYLSFFKVKYPSNNCPEITIRHLLNHSSGIPDAGIFRLIKWTHHDGEPPLNQTAFVEKVLPKYSKLKFEPGKSTSYTNIGYMLLGAIIEKVSGQSYEEYIRQNILEPLKMNETDFVYTSEMEPCEAAGSHPARNIMSPLLHIMAGSYIRETSHRHIWMKRVYNDQTPSSALIGSATDAARLARAYLNKGILDGHRILSEASVELMTNDSHVAKAKHNPSYYFRQGIGWQVYKGKNGYKLEHAGGGPGFYTIMQICPDDNLGLVMFCNDVTLAKYGWKILRLGAGIDW